MDPQGLKFIAVGILVLGMFGSALAVGNIFSSAVKGIARNPSAQKQIFTTAVIGAGLAEVMGLLAGVIVILLLFVVN